MCWQKWIYQYARTGPSRAWQEASGTRHPAPDTGLSTWHRTKHPAPGTEASTGRLGTSTNADDLEPPVRHALIEYAGTLVVAVLVVAPAVAQPRAEGGVRAPAQQPGRSDPSFQQPSIAPGVDYTVPSEAEIKRCWTASAITSCARRRTRSSTPRRAKPITELSEVRRKASASTTGKGEFNDWTYSMGVVLAGMLQVTRGDWGPDASRTTRSGTSTSSSTTSLLPRPGEGVRPAEATATGACSTCASWTTAAPSARRSSGRTAKKQDPRYREGIDLVAAHISKKQTRLPDGTLCRPRPQPVSLWIDDAYMSIPFLAQMGQFTGEKVLRRRGAAGDPGCRRACFDADAGLYDHSWFENAVPVDPKFFWGRGAGWVLMAMAELLTVMPEDHPDRAKVLDQYRRGGAGRRRACRAARASGTSSSTGGQLPRDIGIGDVHVRDRAGRQPRLALDGLGAGGAGRLAGRRAARAARRADRGDLRRDDGGLRRGLLLQPTDRARRDAGLRRRR